MRAPSISRALPAPVGGWDTRDALADMPPQNAVILDNWFPSTDKVSLRSGYAAWATGLGAPVETLMQYAPQSGDQKLFAAAGGSIFDVTEAGAVGAAAVTGMTSARWQTVQIGTPGGQFLLAMNGADTPQLYDGTTWAATTITGPTVANLKWCNLHQRRLWFGEKDSLTAWYLPVNSIGGAASSFSLAAVARRGGSIIAMGTWTRDGSTGLNDYCAFLTSEGEVIVYTGTDPANISTWSLSGVFQIGRPVGSRPVLKTKSDFVFITQDGFVSGSAILPVDAALTDSVALSKQINKAVNTATRTYGGLFGWEAFVYPRGQMLIFNVPQSTTTAHQYVFNTITGAPCRFTGIPALTWGLLDDAPFFGAADGTVYQFDGVRADAGADIAGDALQAFSYFGAPAVKKAFKLIQPIFEAPDSPPAGVGLALEFDTSTGIVAPQPSTSAASPARWGVSRWGVGRWGGGLRIWQGWRGVRGIGRAAAPRVRVTASGVAAQVSWVATNVTFVPGGQI